MKQFINNLKLFAIGAILLPIAIQSCNKTDQPSMYALVTLVQESAISNNYIAKTDDGKKIFFSDKSRVGSYKPANGQRAFIYFTILDEKITGYDYNASLYNVEEIQTKNPVILVDQAKDTLGTNGVGIKSAIIGGGYLTIQMAFEHNEGNFHYFNLVDNQLPTVIPQNNEGAGFTKLEFRHKKKTESEFGNLFVGIVSFRLGDYDPAISGSEGISLRYKNLEGKDFELKIKNDGKSVSE